MPFTAHSKTATKQQLDPLLPGYSFNAHLVAGLTPIEAGGHLDFFIDRRPGMKGFILNLTLQGEGIIYHGDQHIRCQQGDMLLFPPGEVHHYGRHPEAAEWYHQWVYFRPRAYWQEWLTWPAVFGKTGHYRPDEVSMPVMARLFSEIVAVGQQRGRYQELLGMNLLEQLLIRRAEALSASRHQPIDSRILAVCQHIVENLADRDLTVARLAQHACLSASRLSHLFRQQLGVSVLAWREDQRISRARLLLSTTRMPVAAVACNVGFEDQLYFSRVFRKCTGVSPSEFRADCEVEWREKTGG